jgi:hypothetical protein
VSSVTFEAVVGAEDEGVFFEVSNELVSKVSDGKRPPVSVTVNGVTYRTRIAVYGGKSYIPLRRELRQRAGLAVGDRAIIEMNADLAPRLVEVPDDLEAALAENEPASRAFEAMAYTHRKEYVVWVNSAKRPDTRLRRIEETMRRLQHIPASA